MPANNVNLAMLGRLLTRALIGLSPGAAPRGLGMTALTSSDEKLVVVPIRSGLGLRLGYNVGYLKLTTAPTWNPF